MKFTIIIFLFSVLLSKNAIPDTAIFTKGYELKPLNMNIKQLINEEALKEISMNLEFLSSNQIDSIKLVAKDYTPSDVGVNDIVVMETNKGIMKIKLLNDIAPNHCLNFKKLANSGFYDGTTFHRVIPGFMIQGGDILSRDYDLDNDGTGSPGWSIKEEFNIISHKRGILSMARSSDPNSAGSQFFICLSDVPHLDSNYTVFGEVTSKIHVIDRIAKSPTGYSVAKINSKPEIPHDEDPKIWVMLTDPKTGDTIYSKIPDGLNQNSYTTQQQGYLYSDRPMNDVVIKKIRVKPSQEE